MNLCREGGEPVSRGHMSVPIARRLDRLKVRRCVGLRAAIIEAVSIARGCWAQRPGRVFCIEIIDRPRQGNDRTVAQHVGIEG